MNSCYLKQQGKSPTPVKDGICRNCWKFPSCKNRSIDVTECSMFLINVALQGYKP